MQYKAIISDIDGTIAETRIDAFPSQVVTNAIKKSHDVITFSLATGRPFHLVKYLSEHLNLQSPIITDNGAAIVDSKTGSSLWEALLSHNEAEDILTITKDCALTRISCATTNLENPTEIPLGTKIQKISVHDLTQNEMERLISKLESKFKDLAIVRAAAFKGKDFFDVYISNGKATKQHAVLKLAEILNISPHEIIGIGDGYNDFPLLMACGLKVAMGNAVPELKEIADYIAPPVEEDGVADVIERFILQR